MDQYPYGIQQPGPATASYPYPDGPPDKTAAAVAAPPDGVGVAQVPPNPYYLGGGPQVPVPDHQQQVNFTGGFVPAEVPVVPVPNGMIPSAQAPYGSYYPEQQQQQQLGGNMPEQQQQQQQLPVAVQYSQQDYAREANVAPVEYLPPGVGAPPPAVGDVQQLFGEQQQQQQHQVHQQQGMEQMVPPPVTLGGGDAATGMDQVGQQVQMGSEDPSQISTERSNDQLSTPPIEPPTESGSAEPTAASSAPDHALDSHTAPTPSTDPTPTTVDSTSTVPVVDLDDNSKDDCVITTSTSTTSHHHHHHNKKKRRRIVLEDDSDDDEDGERERLELLRSPEPPEEVGAVGNGTIDQVDHDLKEKVGEEEGRGGVEGERLEGDDDRSRSRSPDAPSILQNVVMIPAATAESEAHRRKKIRVLDSDDDEEELPQVATTVDDIGLTGEGADELNPEGGLEGGEDGEFGEGLEQIVAMDAPIIDPSRMLEEGDDDEEEEQNVSDKEKEDKEGSDREEGDAVEAPEPPAEEEVEEEEEEEEAEEGVEMITAEDDAGEAIGIATDDEKDLDEPEEEPASGQNSDPEGEDRGSDQEQDQDASEAGSDAEAASESRSAAENSPSEDENAERSSEERSQEDSQEAPEKRAGGESDNEVVCQNDLELNTISLLTDEEDDNPTPLPTPKKELPVVRIVNIKKELLDVSKVKKERYDPTSYYQQQHQIKQQQLAARKKEKKKKRERNFDNDDPFGAWSSSSTDDEFIPNDIYFGTPDRVFTASTKIRCQRQKQLNERYSAKYGKSGYKRRYSDDSDGEERRKRKQKLEQLSRLNLPSYQQAQLQTMIKKKKKKRHDRFYDKSQDIPNDIYFGNVNVPLHILYAFGDSSSEDERPSTSWRSESSSHSGHHKYHRTGGGPGSRGPYKKSSSSSSNFDRSSVSPSSDRSVQAMREYLKIAGFKHVKFHKLWEGCKSNQERANAILRLMQEKGLEGEPTVAKCKELRKQLQMEREAQVLDTSLIIDSGEGRITRRSKRANASSDRSDPNAPSTSGTFVAPESAEAINRIRSLVDPDSDGE